MDEGIADYLEADFEEALRAFDEAADNATLSVEELLQVFEMRALVHHALQNPNAVRADLERLAAVRPSYRLGRLAPPPVRKAYKEVLSETEKTSPELRIEEQDNDDGTRTVVATVLRVPEGLVHQVFLQCGTGPAGPPITQTTQGTRTELELAKSGRHTGCDAEAQTKQGSVLFAERIEGSALPPPSMIFVEPNATQTDQAEKKQRKRWPWYVAAAAVAITGGVVTGVLVSKRSSNDPPDLGPLTVSW